MTSYNHINGTFSSSIPALVKDTLRGEWGFDGVIMTDWGSGSDKISDLNAGTDLIMGGYSPQPLVAALQGIAPEFAKDGYVLTEVFDIYGGFMQQTIPHWNCFEPSADGPDTVSTTVAAGTELNPAVEEMVSEGIAAVEEQADGSLLVTYHGTDRGEIREH